MYKLTNLSLNKKEGIHFAGRSMFSILIWALPLHSFILTRKLEETLLHHCPILIDHHMKPAKVFDFFLHLAPCDKHFDYFSDIFDMKLILIRWHSNEYPNYQLPSFHQFALILTFVLL